MIFKCFKIILKIKKGKIYKNILLTKKIKFNLTMNLKMNGRIFKNT